MVETNIRSQIRFHVAHSMYNRFPPLFVVSPSNMTEVQDALECATRTSTPVSIKAGGHNYAGFSQVNFCKAPSCRSVDRGRKENPQHIFLKASHCLCACPLSPMFDYLRLFFVWTGSDPQLVVDCNFCRFQINLQSMCAIVNATSEFGVPSIRVGPGCVFVQVYEWLQGNWPDYLLAGGYCPTVGVSGFHLGGGLGALSRTYGMGADNILQATVVTIDGSRAVVANNNSNTDLFWAVAGCNKRQQASPTPPPNHHTTGGGGPSFGVVTEWVLKVHPAFPKYAYGEFCPEDGVESYRAALLHVSLHAKHTYTRARTLPHMHEHACCGLCDVLYYYSSAPTDLLLLV